MFVRIVRVLLFVEWLVVCLMPGRLLLLLYKYKVYNIYIIYIIYIYNIDINKYI